MSRSVARGTICAGTGGRGERAGTRTPNLVIKSHLLYQLSYAPTPVRSAGRLSPATIDRPRPSVQNSIKDPPDRVESRGTRVRPTRQRRVGSAGWPRAGRCSWKWNGFAVLGASTQAGIHGPGCQEPTASEHHRAAAVPPGPVQAPECPNALREFRLARARRGLRPEDRTVMGCRCPAHAGQSRSAHRSSCRTRR